MARNVFISYQHRDQMKAKGFNLLRWNKNVDLTFVGRHLLDPVDSSNESYIRGKIKEQLTGSSVTVVLIGKETCNSEWVRWEIEQSLEKDRPNGILAIRLDDDAKLPEGCPVGSALDAAGAEIIDWDPHKFQAAIERAALAAGRVQSIASAARLASTNIGNCSR
jgi:hypothetical protein